MLRLSGRASEEELCGVGYARPCESHPEPWSRRPAIHVSAPSMPDRAQDGVPPRALGWSQNHQPLEVGSRSLRCFMRSLEFAQIRTRFRGLYPRLRLIENSCF